MSFRNRKTIRRALAGMALLAAAACGSSSTDDGGNDGGGNTACSIKVTGAVTATYACTLPAIAAYTPSTGTSTVAFSYTTTGSNNAVAVAIGFDGQVTKSSHSSSATDVVGGVTVTNGGLGWLAATNGTGTPTGSFTLTITSVTTLASTTSGTSYTVHGTLTGTLQPTSGTGATVTLNATF